MTCREFIEMIDEYLAASSTAESRAECDTHLAKCPYCRDYLKTYRDTISLLKDAFAKTPDVEVSPEVAQALAKAVTEARNPRE